MIKFIVISAGKPIRGLAQRYGFDSLTWALSQQTTNIKVISKCTTNNANE